MRKIISLFQRNYESDKLVRDEVVPGAEWVLAGEGIATRKFDGTCCMVRGGILYKRYDAKAGKKPPAGFEPAQEPDPVTGHHPGWLPVRESDPGDKWFMLAWDYQKDYITDGTYELCGPKVQGNPEIEYVDKELGRPNMLVHVLIPHGRYILGDLSYRPITFDGIKAWLASADVEGVVWYRTQDVLAITTECEMVKIKKKDFGLARKPEAVSV